MKTYGVKKVADIIAISCDRCETTHDDPMEIQEFMCWSDTCGYGNKTFGDMKKISIDLCQYCVKEVLGQWIQTYESPPD